MSGGPASPEVSWSTSGSDIILQTTPGRSQGQGDIQGRADPPPRWNNLGSLRLDAANIHPSPGLLCSGILRPSLEQKPSCEKGRRGYQYLPPNNNWMLKAYPCVPLASPRGNSTGRRCGERREEVRREKVKVR
ncbi:hypothetical protein NHX12_000294 [Muraenolepis orangiensis]|uniref:Uncharacterized protein n=1 Tax=Muraenolepis orangiensis TaxID=630683 RepID=A0A9Q0D7Q8_9TELE|nr:hypothetical protein NHX12_000294 [Muraenolepis orangiensis]